MIMKFFKKIDDTSLHLIFLGVIAVVAIAFGAADEDVQALRLAMDGNRVKPPRMPVAQSYLQLRLLSLLLLS